MASFDPQSEADGDLDFRLMMNSTVTLYWRRTLLDRDVGRLDERGYQIVRLDASGWTADGDLHTSIAATLDFPAYYGRNLDALNDCLRDVVDHEYGWRPNATGLVLVFDGYDAFAHCRPRSAQAVLDIIAGRSRSALLFGRRLLCLVHSDDPHIRFDPVGAVPVVWNDAEWLDANRRPQDER